MAPQDPKNTVNTTPVLSGKWPRPPNSSRDFGSGIRVWPRMNRLRRVWTRELKIGHVGRSALTDLLYGSSACGEMLGWVAIDTEAGATHAGAFGGDLPDGAMTFADGRLYCLTVKGVMTLQMR